MRARQFTTEYNQRKSDQPKPTCLNSLERNGERRGATGWKILNDRAKNRDARQGNLRALNRGRDDGDIHDGRIHLSMRENCDDAMMIGLVCVPMDQCVERRRSRERGDQQEKKSQRRRRHAKRATTVASDCSHQPHDLMYLSSWSHCQWLTLIAAPDWLLKAKCLPASKSFQAARIWGLLKTVYYSDPWWGRGEAISLTAIPRTPETKLGTMSGITFQNVTGRAENSVRINGTAVSRIRDVRLENVAVTLDRSTKYQGGLFDNRPTKVLDPIETHGNPGFSLRYADDISLKNCSVSWGKNRPDDFTQALEAENVTGLRLTGFKGEAAHPASAEAILIH
jgi:hypothetical protein